MRRIRSFLLILVALWLPLQAAAAWTMPLCRHAAAREAVQQTAAVEQHAHCHEQAAASDDDMVAADLGCDNCATCHLSSAGYLLTATAGNLALPLTDAFVALPSLAPPSHIGEPPQQPPRRTS
jgi:ABC-type nickel/cobalt efflux system permease component RcnA